MATKKRASKKKAASTDTIKEGKNTFKKESCHTTVSLAKKKAKALADAGFTYRRVNKCVFKGKKRKATSRRRKK